MFTQLHNGGGGRMQLGCSTKNYLVSCEWLYTHMAWQRKVDSSSRSCLTHWACIDTNHVILTWCCLLHKYITSASMSLSEICCHIWSWVKMFLSGFTSDCYWAITNQQALYVVNEQNWQYIIYRYICLSYCGVVPSECYWVITSQQALYVVNEQNWLHIKYTDTFVSHFISCRKFIAGGVKMVNSYACRIWGASVYTRIWQQCNIKFIVLNRKVAQTVLGQRPGMAKP